MQRKNRKLNLQNNKSHNIINYLYTNNIGNFYNDNIIILKYLYNNCKKTVYLQENDCSISYESDFSGSIDEIWNY